MLKCLNLSQECRLPAVVLFLFLFCPVCKQQPQLCREVWWSKSLFCPPTIPGWKLSETNQPQVQRTQPRSNWAMGIIIVLLKPFHMYWTSPSLITFSTKITINLMPHAWSRSFSNPSIDSTAVYSWIDGASVPSVPFIHTCSLPARQFTSVWCKSWRRQFSSLASVKVSSWQYRGWWGGEGEEEEGTGGTREVCMECQGGQF